jgi:RNA polymerase sigma factor (sigma-70 family)
LAYQSNVPVPRQLGVLFSSGSTGGLTDAQLLRRFTSRKGAPADAEAAFATLVARHAELVWGICQRITGDFHEAEDAFQATFLILARQAGSLWVDDSLGRWLRRVAERVATRARARALRRRSAPALVRTAPEMDPWLVADREDLRAAIADELARLPEKYRAPVELCHVRGLKHEEAARVLELPVGTVKSRLDRGKRRLRDTLTRRGLLPATAAATVAASAEARPAVPAHLVHRTLLAAVDSAPGAGHLPSSVAALVELSSGAAITTKLQIGLGVIVAGTAFAAWGPGVGGSGPSQAPASLASPGAGSPARGPVGPLVGPGAKSRASQAGRLLSATDRRRRRPSASELAGLATAHEEVEGPETDLAAAILRELNNEHAETSPVDPRSGPASLPGRTVAPPARSGASAGS